MTVARDALNYVWSLFRRVGIADDFTIIRHIGQLLLREANAADSGLEHDVEDIDRELRRLELHPQELRAPLADAIADAGSPATLFNRHVLFRLPRMMAGGRYPTPRHITEFMMHLADVRPKHSLADFACGSGGFLVQRANEAGPPDGRNLGIELSAEWAHLARMNMILHGMTPQSIVTGNAIRFASGMPAEEKFDRILMNPPFGEKIDERWASELLPRGTGKRSETALTFLALHKLSAGGCAGILVPSGVLFGSSTGERLLREVLLDEHDLNAVVALPADAFQPFSASKTYLLIVRKRQPNWGGDIWFLQANRDGYPAGRGRDLTEPPSQKSDLPFIQGVLTATGEGHDAEPAGARELGVAVVKIDSAKDGTMLGVVIRASGANALASIRLFAPMEDHPAFLLMKTVGGREQVQYLRIPLDSGEPSEVRERDAFLREHYRIKLKRESLPQGELIFRPGTNERAVAISSEGYLQGVAVPYEQARARSYDLRPEQYMKFQELPSQAKPPALLMADLRRHQGELLQHIDKMLGRLELPPIVGLDLPSPLPAGDGQAVPFGRLSQLQEAVWKQVEAKTEAIEGGESTNVTATLFTTDEVQAGETPEAPEVTRSTLEMLEKMGVVVPVTLADPETGSPASFYRRVTERDLWRPRAGAVGADGFKEV